MGYLRIFWPAAAVLVLACSASAQDIVEYSGGAAKATSATGMRGVGKSAGSVVEKAIKTLDKAAPASASSSSSTTAVTAAKPARKDEPEVKFTAPDPALIALGMSPEELVRKFGEPAMKASGTKESDAGETWWYGTGTDTVTITLMDGKVRSVSPQPPKAEAIQASPRPVESGSKPAPAR